MVEYPSFHIGDRVVSVCNNAYKNIGTVTSITKKRKDIVVDFGNYKTTYKPNGLEKAADIWSMTKIVPLTPEIEKMITNRNLFARCKKKIYETKLTADQARKILEIIESVDE